jgi:hypothetical protein
VSTLTQNARRDLIAAAHDAAGPDTERRSLRWRGTDVPWPVVRVPVAAVLLNHKSHRIQAQLRSLGAAGQIIEEDPYSEEAQAKIADIIRRTKGYETVKATIRRDQQQDPGTITHEGVLVNANTRAVVLRDLYADLGHDEAKHFEYIKVQVLPADANEPEIVQLELSYQMQPNVRQEYTFTNQLLFIRDLLAAGWTPEGIGLEMYRSYNPDIPRDRAAAAKDIETEDRLRQMIEELIASSGGALTWTDFDTERQNLVDIDSSYQSLAARRGIDTARRVKQAKLTGVLAGLDYRRVRLIDESYLDDYVLPAMEEEPNLKPAARALAMGAPAPVGVTELEGLSPLDDLLPDTPEPSAPAQDSVVTLEPLFSLLVSNGKVDPQKDADSIVDLPTDDGPAPLPKSAFFDAVKNAMTVAASFKERDSQGQDALEVPRKQLHAARAACDRARRALDDLADMAKTPDQRSLQAAFDAYLRSHDELVDYLSAKGIVSAAERARHA